MPQKKPKAAVDKPKPAVEQDIRSDQLCAACKTDGENRPAVKYCLDCSQLICQFCVDSHRRIRQIRNHKLVDHSSEEALKGAQSLSTCLACPNHPEKNIEFICKSHNAMCCITCATAGHRNCRQVVEVASQAKAKTSFPDATSLLRQLDNAKGHMEHIVKKHERHNQTVQSQIEVSIPQQLQDMKKVVMETLDALEESAKVETGMLGRQEISRGRTEINKWNSLIKNVTDATALLTAAQQSGTEVQIYVAINGVQKALNEVDKAIAKQGTQLARGAIQFEQGKALQDKNISVNNVLKTLTVDPGHENKAKVKHDALPNVPAPVPVPSPDQDDDIYDDFLAELQNHRQGPGIVSIATNDFGISLRGHDHDPEQGSDYGFGHKPVQANQEQGLGTVIATGTPVLKRGSYPTQKNQLRSSQEVFITSSSGLGRMHGKQQKELSTPSVSGPPSPTSSGFGLFPYRQKPGFHNAMMPKSSQTDSRALASVSVNNKMYALPRYIGLAQRPNKTTPNVN